MTSAKTSSRKRKAREDPPEDLGSKKIEAESKTSRSVNTRSTRSQKRKREASIIKADANEETKISLDDKTNDSTRSRNRKRKASVNESDENEEQKINLGDEGHDTHDTNTNKRKRKRKTAEEKVHETIPLAKRTPNIRMLVGAHVSTAKGVQNSVTNIHRIGGNAFALFLKSQRKWDNPALTNESRDAFHAHCQTHNYDAASHVLPHGSYLVNLAVSDSDRAQQAYDAFVDDLHRCEALGIRLYNFHPGAASQSPLPEAIQRLSSKLNMALAATKTVTPVLENMAGSGTVIGSRFSELRDIISQIRPEFRSRVGVCIDTCHAFAAGYNLSTPESYQAVLQEFDDIVGLKYLKALHLNDSKAPLGSKKDLHQNIGVGFLGLRAFHNVMNDSRLEGLPLILETPCETLDPDDPLGQKMVEDKSIWAREIKLLEELIGMDADSKKFKKLEAELGERGQLEREKMLKEIEGRERKKRLKDEKAKSKVKGQTNLLEMMSGAGKKRSERAGEDKIKDATENGN